MDKIPSFTDPGCPWAQYELGNLLTCEERLCAWVRQPMNTFSNLALFGVAILLFAQASRTGSKTLRDFGLLAFVIGISSSLSHAAQIRTLVFLDFASQFVLISYLIGLNLERIGIAPVHKLAQNRWMLALLLSAIFIIPSWVNQRAGVPIFLILMTLYLLSEYRGYRMSPARDYTRLRASFALFAAAAICFGLDTSKIVCLPTRHLFQLHALWHLLVACSLYALAMHFSQFSSRGNTSEPSR